jgi:hypothetical protein
MLPDGDRRSRIVAAAAAVGTAADPLAPRPGT